RAWRPATIQPSLAPPHYIAAPGYDRQVSVLLVLVGLPLGVIAAAAFGAWRARRSPRLALRAFALGVPLALGAGLVYGFRFPVLVRQLTSSTAGLAYLGLPVAAVIVAAVALPFALALSVLVHF